MRLNRVSLLLIIAAIAAGCGGRGVGGSSLAPSGHALQPQLNGGNPGLTLPTLYVSGQGAVYAYDLGASGNTAPVTKTTGYYYQASGPGGANASIAGITTNTAGDLIIAQNFSNPQGDGNSCDLVYIVARTGPNAANVTTVPCSNSLGKHTTGLAVGVTFTGPPSGASPGAGAFSDDVDVLMHYQPSGDPSVLNCSDTNVDQYQVDRYQATAGSITPHSCVSLVNGTTATYHAIAGSTNGAFFADDGTGGSGTVERYDSAGGTPTNTGTTPGVAGPLAVSANFATSVGYRVVASATGGITTIYAFKVSGGGFTFTHALGTFNNPVGALAVDNNGTIYVGLNQPNGVTKVKVYGPSKTEATNPDYILNNPVRRPNPAASPAAVITGIAISQQNAAPPTPGPATIFVTNTNNTVRVYDQQGNQQTVSGTFPSLDVPVGVAFDPANGFLYIVNNTNNTVTVYDQQGNQQTVSGTFPNLNSPNGIAFDPANGFLYVANSGNNTVTVYDQQGNQQAVGGAFISLNTPYGVALDSVNGLLYVTNGGNNTVKVYDQQGNLHTTSGTFPSLNVPAGIAFDPTNGLLYVANDNNNTVTVYDQTGHQQSVSGTFPNLSVPVGIAFNPANGFLYVTNYSNSTVTVYDQTGHQQTLTGTFPNLTNPQRLVVVP